MSFCLGNGDNDHCQIKLLELTAFRLRLDDSSVYLVELYKDDNERHERNSDHVAGVNFNG